MQKGNQSPATPKRKGPPPEPEGVKEPHYVSINEHEFERLRQLGFRERWAYMELKEISNWKTGVCGEFKRQRLSYAQIARLVTAPDIQGRGMGGIDDTQAAEFLKRFEAVGLVANIGRRANGGLRFDMPLAPIQSDRPAPSGKVTPAPSGKKPVISPDQIAPESLANPAQPRDCDDSPPSLSVLINKELNISNDGADSADAETAPCRVADAAPVPENLPAPSATTLMLTAQEIRGAVAGSWDFTHSSDTPEALTLYESWAEAGVTLDELHAAMTSVECGPDRPVWPTPADITPKLWAMLEHRWLDRLPA